jgi:hypothetical protein
MNADSVGQSFGQSIGDIMAANQLLGPEKKMNEPQGEGIDVGAAEDFKSAPLREAKLGERLVAVSFKDGEFVVCPWHQYKFQRCTGEG